jgi:hypothetical protein
MAVVRNGCLDFGGRSGRGMGGKGYTEYFGDSGVVELVASFPEELNEVKLY